MPPTPQRIRDDLRGLFRGELAFDRPTRAVYAGDASPFELVPLGAAAPRDEADLVTLVQYAAGQGLPLVARGAGTGAAGGALGTGLVVDMGRHFRAVSDVGPDWVRVQAGVTHAELNAALAPHGRRFAPEPPHTSASTVGGLVAANAAGANVYRHGYPRDHVRAAHVVWDNGEPATVLAPGLDPASLGYATPPERGPRFVELRMQTSGLLAAHRDLIQLARPQTRFNRCGYLLYDVLTPGGLDLAKLLVGSEGTLGLLTEVTLATVPVPGATAVAVFGFPTVEAATLAGLTLGGVDGVAGCDLLDQRLLALARAHLPGESVAAIPPEVGAALIVAVEAESRAAALDGLRLAAARFEGRGPFELFAGPTADRAERSRIRRFRDAAIGPIPSHVRGPQPVAAIDDVAVPAEELPRFLHQLRGILHDAEVTASLRVQVLSGQVQARPLLDLYEEADRAKLWPLAEAVHARALALGGTVSSHQGTGLSRTPWVERQYGPLMPVFRELKRIYDPKGILNPGNVVGPDPSRPAWPLRPAPTPAAPVPLLLLTPEAAQTQVANCNGCGECRTRTAGRMCPVFRATGDEAATPRAKAYLVGAALAARPGDAEPVSLATEEAKAVAALCVHCKMCPRECRGRVDVPRLALEAKAAYHAANGLDRVDWAMARVESLANLSARVAFTANTLLRTRPARWLVEKLLGVSRRRTLPRLTHRTFLARAWRMGLTARPRPAPPGAPDAAPKRKVAYFVDLYANVHDPAIGLATVAVLKHQGVEVHVPWRQRACGLAPLVQGDIETAREIAGYNLRTLAALVREGYTVVCSEPTAALTLTQEYPLLVDTPDAELVAANTVELSAYLWGLHRAGELRTDFQRLDVNLGHHVPCHVKALGGPVAGPDLLGLIPGVQAYPIDAGCSGMAGTWGLRADSFDDSMAAGQALFAELDRPRVIYGSTECSPCRMQMQQGSRKRTMHPVQYLALAYGLMPELKARLAKPLGRRVTD